MMQFLKGVDKVMENIIIDLIQVGDFVDCSCFNDCFALSGCFVNSACNDSCQQISPVWEQVLKVSRQPGGNSYQVFLELTNNKLIFGWPTTLVTKRN